MKFVTDTEQQRSIITEEVDDLKEMKDHLDVKLESSKTPRTLKSPRGSYLKSNIMKRYEPKRASPKKEKRSKTTH